jgi:anti-anti-sigma regulatory factor
MILIDAASRSQASGPDAASGRAGPESSVSSQGSAAPGWSDATGKVRARLDTVGETPVVRVVAELDRHALRPCREALDQALGSSPAGVVVDLGGTRDTTSITIAFLGCMRRYLQARGSDLVLAGAPDGLWEVMDRVHVLPLYAFEATATQAVAAVKARAARRPAVDVNLTTRTGDGGAGSRDRDPGPRCCVGCLDCS